MTTEETMKHEEQRERMLTTLRQMVENKRAYEKQALEDYKNDPELQALVAKLDRQNAERGTPIA